MASTPFRVVNWSPNEVIGQDKMEQTNTNVVWLRDNTPRVVYTRPRGLRRVEGLRIASGAVAITARKSDSANVTVHFNNLFVENCQPNITTGIVSKNQKQIFATISGIGHNLHPDNRGFEVHVLVSAEKKKRRKIAKTFYITWQAMGYYTA